MPAQRSRGAYAKYICQHCRSRKIKCVLPDNYNVTPTGQPQPIATSCQRCALKGLDCIVDYTTLGRPSQQNGTHSSSTRMKVSPHSDVLDFERAPSIETNVSRSAAPNVTFTEESVPQRLVDDYLIVRPQRITDDDDPSEPQSNVATMDKFIALGNQHYLMSLLLLRDKQFGCSFTIPRRDPTSGTFDFLDGDMINLLDRSLSWHKFYYPDLPSIAKLYAQIHSDLNNQDRIVTTFLLALLCSLALDVPKRSSTAYRDLRNDLDGFLAQAAQHVVLTIPEHRYTILGLELLTEWKPLTFATERVTAAYAVRGRLTPALIMDVAGKLGIDRSPQKLNSAMEANEDMSNFDLLHEVIQWYRICLADVLRLVVNRQRQPESEASEKINAAEVVHILRGVLQRDSLPPGYLYALHSLLCKAQTLEHHLRAYADWRNLESLGEIIDCHTTACEEQQEHLKKALQKAQTASQLRPGEAIVISQLIETESHSSFVQVSGGAVFFAIMAGAEAKRGPTNNKMVAPEQAMEISDQIIERFADVPDEDHVGDVFTAFIVKYGERSTDDMEKGLTNLLTCMENLRLDGIPYVGPVRRVTSEIMYKAKQLMEGQATRMKGWGGLHERAQMHLLVMRALADSLERMGFSITGQSGPAAITKGCLWAATARLLRSLYKLLADWKEWNALGHAKIVLPASRSKPAAGSGQQQQQGFQEFDDLMDLLPDEMFFDWDLWLNQEDGWSFL